ncbi:hypothetical protein [Treponema sp. R80B11-R83G3]
MMKKNVKHILLILLIIGFIVLALGSTESSPSYYDNSSSGSSGGSGGGGSSTELNWIVFVYYSTPNDSTRRQITYTVRTSTQMAAEDEGERQFRRTFPTYKVEGVTAIKGVNF